MISWLASPPGLGPFRLERFRQLQDQISAHTTIIASYPDMSRDLFNQGFGALSHPDTRKLHFGFGDEPALSLPPPPPIRGHQRSRTSVDLPPLITRTQSHSPTRPSAFSFLRPGSTRSLSPERATPAEAAEFTVEAQSPTKRRSGGLAAWFEGGSSAPVNIGLVPSPQKERLDPVEEVGTSEELFSQSQESLDTHLTRRPQQRPTPSGPTVSNMSKFNPFRRSMTTLTSPEDGDELAQLEVEDALFPHGRSDEYSPAAFKNLQQNAEGTIRRYQQAYKDQRQSLRTAISTRNVQADELEAAEMRNEQLKLQLQEMADRAADRAAEQAKMITEMRATVGGTKIFSRHAAAEHQDGASGCRLQPSSEVPPQPVVGCLYVR